MRYGPHRVVEAGLVVFAPSSLASGLATTPVPPIAARALQGTGAVLLTPAALSLVLAISPGAAGAAGCSDPLRGRSAPSSSA